MSAEARALHRIAIYTGSFKSVHTAHLQVINWCVESGGYSKVYLVSKNGDNAREDQLRLLQSETKWYNKIEISQESYEETIARIQREYPEASVSKIERSTKFLALLNNDFPECSQDLLPSVKVDLRAIGKATTYGMGYIEETFNEDPA